MPNSASLTIKYLGRTNVLHSQCWVSAAFDPADQNPTPPAHAELLAIWDTGATNTSITEAAANRLSLVATGVVKRIHAQGEDLASTYLINITLPNGVAFSGLTVTECKLPPGADVLIGMDIIGAGDFAVTNHDNTTAMSYRAPSSKCIDFVVEHNADVIKEQARALIRDRSYHQHKAKKKTGRGKHK
jgi:hypothetical protein